MNGIIGKLASKLTSPSADKSLAQGFDRLPGKKVCLAGKFEFGVKELLEGMVEAQQGTLAEELDSSVDFLVLPDLNAGKTVQKKAAALNVKGATVQVIDADSFKKLIEPTSEELVGLLKAGQQKAALFAKSLGSPRAQYYQHRNSATQTQYILIGEKFDGVDLHGFNLGQIAFQQCTFTDGYLTKVNFVAVAGCDFSGAAAMFATFWNVDGGIFRGADLEGAEFHGSIASADFTSAKLDNASFSRFLYGHAGAQQLNTPGCIFAASFLRKAKFINVSLASPDFDGADLSDSIFNGCKFATASFRKASLRGANFVGSALPRANFSGADCRLANFADADLTDANFDGADLADCNLRGANLANASLSKAKNYNPAATPMGSVGPALRELDALIPQARRIRASFRVRKDPAEDGEEVGIDSAGLAHGWGLRLPRSLIGGGYARQPGRTFSDGMLQLANRLNIYKVRYETVDVSSTKSPKGGKDLRDLIIAGISEAFAQPVPSAEELAAATKAFRAERTEQQAVDRERLKKVRELAAKEQMTVKKQIAKKIAKEVGAVTDITTFLKALELRVEKPKIDKATKMLKAERFKLFNDITETHLCGVVKSQTDADLVYACRIESGGQYACCTQNLNICGGLRGSICKHLLVLIIGLVKAGELDPATIDRWVSKTHGTKSELDKEKMGEIFLRYKGAEAGEVDWRPTETVPEDYYAL